MWQQLHSKARSGLEAATSIQEMEIFSGEQIQAKVGLRGGGVLGLGNKIYHGNCVAQHPRVRTVTSIMIILWMAERTGGVKARLAGESPPRS